MPARDLSIRVKPTLEVFCEPLQASAITVTVEPSSCGLDFWHSATGLHWSSAYLQAEPARFRIAEAYAQAGVTCLVRRLPGGLSLASVYPYGRIEGDSALFWRSIPALAKSLRHNRIVRLEIPFTGPYDMQLDLAPSTAAIHVRNSMNSVRHVLDLSTTAGADLEGKFDPNIRWAVRKAKREGCTVRIATSDDIDSLQALYAQTMRAKKAPVNYGPKRWAGIASELTPKNQGCLYIGEIDGQPRGMAAAVDGQVSRHLVQLAVPPAAQSTRLGELLVMTTMLEAKTKGLRYYDFMASPISDTGLINYKAKWGTSVELIRHVVISGMPGLNRIVDFARWANRTRARLRGT